MDFKNFFFQHIKGGAFGSKKSNLALVIHNLNRKKNLQMQISFIYAQVPRNEPAPPHVDYHPTLPLTIILRDHAHIFYKLLLI